MIDKIYCLMAANGSLSEEDRNLLFHTARRLYHSGQKRQAIRTPEMEGLVTTQREFTRLGSTVGMKFSAVLESVAGKRKVEYIVRPCHLDPVEMDGAVWGQVPREVFRELLEVGLN